MRRRRAAATIDACTQHHTRPHPSHTAAKGWHLCATSTAAEGKPKAGKAPAAQDPLFLLRQIVLSLLVKSREKEKVISKDLFWIHVSKGQDAETDIEKAEGPKENTPEESGLSCAKFPLATVLLLMETHLEFWTI